MLVTAIVIVLCMLILGNFIIRCLDVVAPKKFDENEYFEKLKKVNLRTKDLPSTERNLVCKSKLDKEKPTSYVDQQQELNVDLTKSGEDIKDLYDPVGFGCKPDIRRDAFSQSLMPHVIKTDTGKVVQKVGGHIFTFEGDFEGISGANHPTQAQITRCGPSRDIKEFLQDGYY